MCSIRTIEHNRLINRLLYATDYATDTVRIVNYTSYLESF
jgi:hypothetical protein